MGIFSSTGLKRYIAVLLNLVSTVALPIAALIPGLMPLITWLQAAAAAFGGAGLVHSGIVVQKSANPYLNTLNPTNISAVLAVLLVVAKAVPSLSFLVPFLEALVGMFGGAAIVTKLKVQ